jgi:peptidyl-Asp metalloendopeptidase
MRISEILLCAGLIVCSTSLADQATRQTSLADQATRQTNPAGAEVFWQLHARLPTATRNALSIAAVSAVVVQPQFDLSAQTEIKLPLADGTELQLRRLREERTEQTVSWFGQVLGDENSTVVLTHVRTGKIESWAGYIQTQSKVYEISPSAQGTVLMEIDDSQFPNCGGALAPPTDSPAAHAQESLPLLNSVQVPRIATVNDAPNEIDVLIVFRPGSVTQLGGQNAARAFAQNAVNVSNQAFSNSQMLARFRLAGVSFTTESDSGTASGELSWVISNAQVAAARNALGADLVSVIAEFSDACGVGYLMNQLGTGFATGAFQATARSCAIGNLSYTHEHGHNMGLTHDPGNGNNNLFPSFGFGHFVSGSFRTVMSYANNCAGGCTRAPYFSNPNVSYRSAPTGIADQRDNARAGNITAPDVANFRASLGIVFASGFE